MAQIPGGGAKNVGRDDKGKFIKGHPTFNKRLPDSFCLTCGKKCPKPHFKFCSHLCCTKNKIGKKNWWGYKISKALTGQVKTKEHIEKVRQALLGRKRPDITGEKCSWWKGNKVGYCGLHDWVRKKLGYPKNCKHCKKEAKRNNGRWNVHWANKSKKYKRNIRDWIPLCRKCHYRYDLK